MADLWSQMIDEARDRVKVSVADSDTWYAMGVFGPPGAGKSTALAELVALEPRLRLVRTRAFHAAQSRMARYIDRLFVSKETTVALVTQLEALSTRFLMQVEAPANGVVDEPIEAVLAHSRSLWLTGALTEDDLRTWLAAYEIARRLLPSPKLLVVLRAEQTELQRRWIGRGRLRDQSVSDSYMSAHVESIQNIANALASDEIHVHEVDTTVLSPRDVASRLAELIYAGGLTQLPAFPAG